MPICNQCNRSFETNHALTAHCSAKAHFNYRCIPCNRVFVDQLALQQHLDNAPIHQSESDNSDNSDYEWDDDTDSDADSDLDSDTDTYCRTCDRSFIHREALYQHLSASAIHNWCFVCSRDFEHPVDLARHNASRVHEPADMKCPLCSRMFKSPSDIANHIESGSAGHSRINRHHVTAAVHRMEITPPISISRQIAGPPSIPTVTEYVVTQLAFNGKAYECYLCHRQCRTLRGLNDHLNSPAHDDDQFQCPHGKCGKQFTVISALIRHIESESCGLAKFRTVEKYTNQLTAQFSRLLTF
ncbi:hypothetical protein VKT23_001898 [Stygiomarasmius scandens]|uniref:C2H2-type domain-containing protein n=1 Tax=Marasmiellus scandens TaxID=2682957 RepID=A0ABR1K1M0_9AGAR